MYGMKCFTVLRITTEDHVSEDRHCLLCKLTYYRLILKMKRDFALILLNEINFSICFYC